MRLAASAYKHGITAGQIRHLVEHWWPPFPVVSARDPAVDVWLYVGEDRRGTPLEVIGVEEQDESGVWDLVIFHAMKLRPAYRRYYEEVWRWRQGG